MAAVVGLAVTLLDLRDVEAAGTYEPTLAVEHCNGLSSNFPGTIPYNDPELVGSPGCVGANPLATNSAADVTITQQIPSGDMNPGTALFLTGPGDDYVAPDSSITNGTKVGGVSSTVTFTLLNNACQTWLTQEYILYESTTSNSNTVDPLDLGTPDHLSNLAVDSNADGFADSTSPFTGANPSFYPTVFDPDLDAFFGINGPESPVLPIARYTGMTQLHPSLGGEWSMLSVFVFNASSLAPFADHDQNIPHPLARVGRGADGRVLLALIDDPLEAPYGQSEVIRSCSPTTTTVMLLGTLPNAQVRARTPTSSGTRGFGAWSYSARDADSDGIDNALDTCPFVTNIGSDPDGDGIDSACDPTPTINTNNGDHDGDGFQNRDDNCPLVANWPQSSEREMEMYYITAAPDGGPRGDGIGNHCDPNPFTGYSEGDTVESYVLVPKCFGGPDNDGDRYCAAQDIDDNSSATKGFTLNKGPDMDGLPTGDRFGANVEQYVGTDPLKACNRTTTANDESVDAWPVDFDDNGVVNIIDVLKLKTPFNTTVPPTAQRYDISPSKTINIIDVLQLKTPFNTRCGITTRIDLEPAYEIANTATLIGSPEACREIPVGEPIEIDVTVSAIPPVVSGEGGITGFEFTLKYDSGKLKVTAVDYSMLIAAESPSLPLYFGDTVPDTDGKFHVAVADFWEGVESGAGVLARITVEALASGLASLSIWDLELIGEAPGSIPYTAKSIGATIAIGTTCP